MRKMLSFIIIMFLVCLVCGISSAEQIDDLLKQAQGFYDQRDKPSMCENAVETYEKVLKANSNNYEALWKLARGYKWLGDHAPKEKRLEIFDQGKNYAKLAIGANPKGVEGHIWCGSNLGRYGEEKGVMESLKLLKPIEEEMKQVLELNAQHEVAHYVLGILYRKAPGWPVSIGSMEEAQKHALLAVKYGPNETYTHLGLAEYFIDKKEYKKAVPELQKVLQVPLDPDYTPEGQADKARAAEIIKWVRWK